MLKKGLIVSCQAEGNSWFNNTMRIAGLASEVAKGGCVALRICGLDNLKEIRYNTRLPIIGLTKGKYPDGSVWITPMLQDAVKLQEAGADYVAMDATFRSEISEDHSLINFEKALATLDVPVIADVANYQQAEKAADMGCKYISTALSGYYKESVNYDHPPALQLVKDIALHLNVTVLAEGRYWNRPQVAEAYRLGANNVVIGTAITRPRLITKYFAEVKNVKDTNFVSHL